jgi:hypothetical protein
MAPCTGGGDATVTVPQPILVAQPALAPAQMQTEYEPGAKATVPTNPWPVPAPGTAVAPSVLGEFAVIAVHEAPTWIAMLTDAAGLSGQIAQPATETWPIPPAIESMCDWVAGGAATTTFWQPILVAPPDVVPAQMHTV